MRIEGGNKERGLVEDRGMVAGANLGKLRRLQTRLRQARAEVGFLKLVC